MKDVLFPRFSNIDMQDNVNVHLSTIKSSHLEDLYILKKSNFQDFSRFTIFWPKFNIIFSIFRISSIIKLTLFHIICQIIYTVT